MNEREITLCLSLCGLPQDLEPRVYIVKASENWEITEKNLFSERKGNLLIWRRQILEPQDVFKLVAQDLSRDLAWYIFTSPHNPWHRLPRKWFGWDYERWWFTNQVFPILDQGQWCENNLFIYDGQLVLLSSSGAKLHLFEVIENEASTQRGFFIFDMGNVYFLPPN